MIREGLTPDAALAAAVGHHALVENDSSLMSIADAVVGLHNTMPMGPYLSLHARAGGFVRAELDELMWQDWALVRFRAMRLTMFVFPTDLLEIAAAATRHLSTALAERWPRDSKFSTAEFDRLADMIHAALSDGPLTVRELRRRIGVTKDVDVPGVVARMCDTGWLVGGAPPKSWRSAVRRYHRWTGVLPAVDIERWDEASAITELIRRYVAAYGPVTVADIAWWTGMTKARTRMAIESLGTAVEIVDVEGWPGPLYRTAGQSDIAEFDSSVRALPVLDPYVQGYRDRGRFLEPERSEYVYDGGGNCAATLVYHGRIVGVWQFADAPAESVRYHLFSKQPPAFRDVAEADLAAAGLMYFDREVDVVEIAHMKPLSAEGGRSASHPLDDRLHRASRRRSGDAEISSRSGVGELDQPGSG